MRGNGAPFTRTVWLWQAPLGCDVELSLSPPLPLPPPPQNVCLLNSFAAFASMASFGSTFHTVPACCPPQPQQLGSTSWTHCCLHGHSLWPGAICALCPLSSGVPIQHHEPTNRTCSFSSIHSGWGTDTCRDCVAAMLTGTGSDAKGLLKPPGLWGYLRSLEQHWGQTSTVCLSVAPRLSWWMLLVPA